SVRMSSRVTSGAYHGLAAGGIAVETPTDAPPSLLGRAWWCRRTRSGRRCWRGDSSPTRAGLDRLRVPGDRRVAGSFLARLGRDRRRRGRARGHAPERRARLRGAPAPGDGATDRLAGPADGGGVERVHGRGDRAGAGDPASPPGSLGAAVGDRAVAAARAHARAQRSGGRGLRLRGAAAG